MDKYVKVSMGGRDRIIPLEDYLDIQASQNGFDNYESMKKEGYSIYVSEDSLCDKNGNPLNMEDMERE